MAFSAALLAKGLAGVGAVSLVATGLIFLSNDDNKKINKKIEKLGIDESCYFKENKTTVTCTLNKTKLEKIKFDGKNGNTVTANASVSLKIEKLTEEDISSGLLFTFTNSAASNVEIGDNDNKITFKTNISTDFKIKKDGNNLKLEKAWTIKSLGDKVGLSCSGDNATSCTLTTGKINVWKDQDNYVLEATLATGSSSSMSVTKDTANYNQGFKLTVSADTNLTQNTEGKKVGTVEKLTQSTTNSTSYEIALKDHKGTKTWFLVEKSTPASSVPQESQ